MKILVPITAVFDPAVKPVVADDGVSLVAAAHQLVMNPFDEVALTAAVSLKQSGQADAVVAVSVGEEICRDMLRSALAMQADRAIWIKTESRPSSSQIVALLAAIVRQESPDLILCGKQSADDDACKTPQQLAGFLDYPQIVSVSSLRLENGQAIATADYGKGMAMYRTSLPAVLGIDLLLCAPKFPSLAHILKSKKMPIEEIEATGLVDDHFHDTPVIGREVNQRQSTCQYLTSVSALANVIKNIK